MTRPAFALGVANSAWPFVAAALALGALLGLLWAPLGLVGLVLAVYVLWFFRDPRRKFRGGPDTLCSPADGKVDSVLELPCPEMPGGRAIRVAIFLNIFDVHIQRAPCHGRVLAVKHRPGKMLNALSEKCSEENEAVTVWMRTPEDRVVGVRQLTGLIARRIECWVKPGDTMRRTERYGLIRFGSRVELYLPLGTEVLVRPDDKVAGGLTPIAKFAKAPRP
jgi:phosphatidylserine decarboxylase